MRNPVETKVVDGVTIKIYPDDDDFNPRTEYDNLGTMLCYHRNYNLGDVKASKNTSMDECKAVSNRDDVVALPLYLYDHSGITMSTSAFSCPWDSGQVGIIYVTHEKIKAEYGDTSPETLAKVKTYLVGEVETYDQYLRGDVYGFVLEDEDGEDLGNSCWGFFGMEFCLEEAESAATAEAKYRAKQKAEVEDFDNKAMAY